MLRRPRVHAAVDGAIMAGEGAYAFAQSGLETHSGSTLHVRFDFDENCIARDGVTRTIESM